MPPTIGFLSIPIESLDLLLMVQTNFALYPHNVQTQSDARLRMKRLSECLMLIVASYIKLLDSLHVCNTKARFYTLY